MTPALRSAAVTCLAAAMSFTSAFSVISTSSRDAGKPHSIAMPSSLSGVAGSQTSLLVRLNEIAISPGHVFAAWQPRRSIDEVNALIRPNCSTIGMNGRAQARRMRHAASVPAPRTGDFPRAHVDDGLEAGLDVFVGDGAAHLRFQCGLQLGSFSQRGGIGRPRPARGLLGLVERHVGAAEQDVRVAAVARKDRKTDAGADLDLEAADRNRPAQFRDQPVGACTGRRLHVRLAADQHDAEFVAAEPRHHAIPAGGGGQPPRGFLDDEVAYGVAVHVVDRLEPVEINQQHGKRRRALAVGRQPRDLFGKAAAVGQVRQRVEAGKRVRCLAGRLGRLVCLFQLRKVALVGQFGLRGADLLVLELGDIDIGADPGRVGRPFSSPPPSAAGPGSDPAAVHVPLAILEAEVVDLAAVGLPDMLAHAFEDRPDAGLPKVQESWNSLRGKPRMAFQASE